MKKLILLLSIINWLIHPNATLLYTPTTDGGLYGCILQGNQGSWLTHPGVNTNNSTATATIGINPGYPACTSSINQSGGLEVGTKYGSGIAFAVTDFYIGNNSPIYLPYPLCFLTSTQVTSITSLFSGNIGSNCKTFVQYGKITTNVSLSACTSKNLQVQTPCSNTSPAVATSGTAWAGSTSGFINFYNLLPANQKFNIY